MDTNDPLPLLRGRPAMRSRSLESTDLPRQCLEALLALGLPARMLKAETADYRGHRRGRLKSTGWPDVHFVLPPSGRACYVECKTGRGWVKANQQEMHDKLRAAGALVIVARTRDDMLNVVEKELMR